MGGPQITKHISHIAKNRHFHNLVDVFITGDGELPLKMLLDETTCDNLSTIPNLYYKKDNSPKDYIKSTGFFRQDPRDFTVPDFTGFDPAIYRRQLPLMASKGCFWNKCNFCTYATINEHRYAITTPEKSIEIIKGLKERYNVSNFRFVDDALPPRFMKGITERISKESLNIKWTCSIILSKDFADLEFCRTLRDSGLYQVSIGLESITPRVLHLMNKCHKDLTQADIKHILTSLKDAAINIGLHIIFGFPGETLEEARQTLKFLVENRSLYDTCMFQPFCLEDNTHVFNNYKRFGITNINRSDKTSGERLGYRYDVSSGMSQAEAADFTYREALKIFKSMDVSAKSRHARAY